MALSDEHKAALAKGRAEARAVRAYLDALNTKRPRGKLSSAGLKERLDSLANQIEIEKNSLKRLQMIQQRFDVEDKLKLLENAIDYEALESEFVSVAASYSERKGITYSAWREGGVAPDVLKAAGIRRTRRT